MSRLTGAILAALGEKLLEACGSLGRPGGAACWRSTLWPQLPAPRQRAVDPRGRSPGHTFASARPPLPPRTTPVPPRGLCTSTARALVLGLRTGLTLALYAKATALRLEAKCPLGSCLASWPPPRGQC